MAGSYRLPSDLQADLTWYWTEADSELGVCSSQGAQEAALRRRAPPEPPKSEPRLSGLERWRMGDETERRRMREERWAKRDAEIRAMWMTMEVHDDASVVTHEDPLDKACREANPEATPLFERVPLPSWAQSIGYKGESRILRVHATVCRLVRLPEGPKHERILFRVYGDMVRDRRADELDRLGVYAPTWQERDSMLTNASRAYSDCNKAERNDRVQARRAKWRAMLGAA